MIQNVYDLEVSEDILALVTETSRTMFEETDGDPKEVKKSFRGRVPWGSDNELPYQILTKIRASEIMSSNHLFNTTTLYGGGLKLTKVDGSPVIDETILTFKRRNNLVKYLLEQSADMKAFYWTVSVLILNNKGDKVVQLKHKEVINCRFETCNTKTGRIENVFFANWKDSPKDEDIEAIPILDMDDPLGDLLIRMGTENDPKTGKKRPADKKRKFAIVSKFPLLGNKYYPFAPYWSVFESGWYDVAVKIPLAKKAMLINGMVLKYHIEMHQDYWSKLFNEENITDKDKQVTRKKLELNNIKNFLTGAENQGKMWISKYYKDPNGNEQSMVKITRIGGNSKEGGDYIEDGEEASNMICYAFGIHPNLIGAAPGKSKGNMSGTDKRELFTMKQAMERSYRDLTLTPLHVVQNYNKWDDLVIDIPDLMLTTLDKGTDAKEVTSNPDKQEE